MKILLLGEYSSLHRYLKEGLFEIGYKDVTLASNGDGWKENAWRRYMFISKWRER